MEKEEWGTFEGFNFREQAAMERRLTAEEVLAWDHDKNGEAEFWPSGDSPAVRELFKGCNSVSGDALGNLLNLVETYPGHRETTLLLILFMVRAKEIDLAELTIPMLDGCALHTFSAESFRDARKSAAYELFETYWPELYQLWEKTPLDGLRFDPDEFLDSPSWEVLELTLGETRWVLVSPA